MRVVKGKPLLVEKRTHNPLGLSWAWSKNLEKKKIMIVLFFITVSKYVTRNMENCIFGICNNAMSEDTTILATPLVGSLSKVQFF